MVQKVLAATILAAIICVPALGADGDEEVKLKVGDKAPDFALPKAEGAAEDAPKRLTDFKGKQNVLLAFYPKADTPGCTKQLCGYRDDFNQFKSQDTTVIAISTDKQAASDAFKTKFEMPFTVLGDAEKKIVKAYGIPTMIGLGLAQRSVVLIDKEGVIRFIDLKYDINKDKTVVYEQIAKLNETGEEEAEQEGS
jgi:peroxiredoxin Q/BCP